MNATLTPQDRGPCGPVIAGERIPTAAGMSPIFGIVGAWFRSLFVVGPVQRGLLPGMDDYYGGPFEVPLVIPTKTAMVIKAVRELESNRRLKMHRFLAASTAEFRRNRSRWVEEMYAVEGGG